MEQLWQGKVFWNTQTNKQTDFMEEMNGQEPMVKSSVNFKSGNENEYQFKLQTVWLQINV